MIALGGAFKENSFDQICRSLHLYKDILDVKSMNSDGL